MRTLKMSLLVFILSISIPAQWYQQNSGTTNQLWSVQFVNDQVGWTHSYQDLYKTTNGGQSWQYQYTQNPMFQIFFYSENVGWISAWQTGPEILKTTDGGDTWVEIYSIFGSTEFIHDFEFVNPDTGWIVGEETISTGKDDSREFPVLFKETTDGGITWIDKSFPPNFWGRLDQIDAIDYMNLIVADDDTLFKTTDGGNNWQQLPLPQIGQSFNLQFIDMDLGWICETSALFKTTNGGISWNQQTQPVNNFQFITSQVGWSTLYNQIYHSTDGGDSWNLQNSNTNNTLSDIFFLDNSNGWAVGANGTILHTINGGIPVELISFNAGYIEREKAVELTWSTATETNNSGFEILRAIEVDDWNKVGFVSGHGTTAETQHYSFTDNDVKPSKYQYKLKQNDYDGSFEYSQVVEIEIPFVNEFSLEQNYPNPFNPATTISFQLPAESFISLKVYDAIGTEVETIAEGEYPDGVHEVIFSADNLSSGLYLYRIISGKNEFTRKMLVVK